MYTFNRPGKSPAVLTVSLTSGATGNLLIKEVQYDGTMGAVWRYDLTAGNWTNITPVSGSDLYFGFGGLGLDTLHPGTLVVAALNSWWPEAQIFRSTDSGATWSRLWEWTSYPTMARYYSISSPSAPWIYNSFVSTTDAEQLGWMIESLEIDPFDSDHWL